MTSRASHQHSVRASYLTCEQREQIEPRRYKGSLPAAFLVFGPPLKRVVSRTVGAGRHCARQSRRLPKVDWSDRARGRPDSIDSSSLHLDVLRDLKRIHSHICSVAYPVLERVFCNRAASDLP